MPTLRGVMWLIHRMAVMSPVELAHRLVTTVRNSLDRLAWRVTGRWPHMDLANADQFGFMVSHSPRLFVPPAAIPEQARQQLLQGRIRVFGRWVSWQDQDTFWHRDPGTGTVWPHRAGEAPEYRPGNPAGDVRIVWELNRLQHLAELAMLARQHPEAQDVALRLMAGHIASWARANPFPDGVHHTSAMEEALRVLALFHTMDLARNGLGAPAREAIIRILLTHAWHIERKLSLYSSAGNHTIAEAVGLLYLGILLPEHRRAGRWTAIARQLLAAESSRQVRSDGGPLEQATWYLLFITDLLGLAQSLLAHTQAPPIPPLDAAVARARNFLGRLASSPADLPRIGDADDGYALTPYLTLSWPDGPGAPALATLPATGITVASFEGHDQLLFLHKDLGMAPTYGHGHSDALSVVFRWRGQAALLDPGTYLYGGPPEWRSHFRSAFAHNTVTIDGTDGMVQTGPFLWRSGYHSRVDFSKLDNGLVTVLALCDSYGRQGFTHWRGVLYRQGCYLAVWDLIQGSAMARQVTIRWHVGGTLTPSGEGACQLELPSGDLIRIRLPAGRTSTLRGATEPLRGWRSAHYTHLEPCDVIECLLPAGREPEALTVFELGREPPASSELDNWVKECRTRTRQAGPRP